jgi:serine/threonine protein kinase
VLRSILSALEYLYNKNITYRDIKPENILISCLFIPKLSDFSLSSIKVRLVTRCRTEAYLAPEIRQPGYNSRVDV